jgi:bifunctional non-homologous end joining protein LigD
MWVEPKLLARIEFRGLTEEGMLRHPSFKGLVSEGWTGAWPRSA